MAHQPHIDAVRAAVESAGWPARYTVDGQGFYLGMDGEWDENHPLASAVITVTVAEHAGRRPAGEPDDSDIFLCWDQIHGWEWEFEDPEYGPASRRRRLLDSQVAAPIRFEAVSTAWPTTRKTLANCDAQSHAQLLGHQRGQPLTGGQHRPTASEDTAVPPGPPSRTVNDETGRDGRLLARSVSVGHRLGRAGW
jgi:hypothetical protein